jgi:hypothetical protein
MNKITEYFLSLQQNPTVINESFLKHQLLSIQFWLAAFCRIHHQN